MGYDFTEITGGPPQKSWGQVIQKRFHDQLYAIASGEEAASAEEVRTIIRQALGSAIDLDRHYADHGNNTLLSVAINNKRFVFANALLDAGCVAISPNLHKAIRQGASPGLVKKLIEAGAEEKIGATGHAAHIATKKIKGPRKIGD